MAVYPSLCSIVPSNPRRNIDIKIKNNIVILSTPIYELPETTFTGVSGQRISSGYRLLQPTSSASSVNLADWTLFINITVNNCTSNNWLYEDGAWIGSSSNYGNIQGGMHNSRMVLNDGYDTLVTGTSGVGKVAVRRKLGNDYVQYSTDGKTWVDIERLYIPNLIDRTAKMLTFGGKADSSTAFLGNGTISAKLWNSALDDISSLFK